MSKVLSLMEGLGVGVAAAYLLDPQKGSARRSQIRDKVKSAMRAKMRAKEALLKDARNRFAGVLAETRARFTHRSANDRSLTERIRSEMGHCISHAKAIDVEACNGTVRLSGPILEAEVQPLIDCLWNVPGVKAIEHKLETHLTSEGVPSLQGEHKAMDAKKKTDPAESIAYAVAGGLLALYGLKKRGPIGKMLTASGLSLLAKAEAPYLRK